MIRQYRIERFQGMEVLVCECFRKHTWTQQENDAFLAWKHDEELKRPNEVYLREDFNRQLEDFLSLSVGGSSVFYGLSESIPVLDNYTCLILSGAVVDNRLASLQVDYVASMLPPEILHEISFFYGVFDSRHWRNMVSLQVEKYGSLFGSEDD